MISESERTSSVVKGAAIAWDRDGTYYTKTQLLKLMADTKSFRTNTEKLSDLKVRVYGNTAVGIPTTF